MPAEMDTTDGVTSFASAREDAWHRLGTVLPDAMTAEQAMEYGHLGGWNVRKAPITANDPETGEVVPVATHVGILRDNPVRKGQVDSLGITGPRYEIIQNEAHADFLNAMVDESEGRFETVGALDGGRRVFITLKLPESMLVGGVDPVDKYLAAINSHDSTSSFMLMVTNVRIVCQNTLNAALASNSGIFKIRHTSGAKQSVQEAREKLKLAWAYEAEFEEAAERLVQTTLTEGEFMDIVSDAFGAPEDAAPATITRAEARLDQIQKLFVEAGTQEAIRDTAWAGFNAITEYLDHFTNSRGDDHGYRQAVRSIDDRKPKTNALELMLATV